MRPHSEYTDNIRLKLRRTRNPMIRRTEPPNVTPPTDPPISSEPDNVATAYSQDKKKMLRLTIIQRRTSIEDAPTPTSSVGSSSSQSSAASVGSDGTGTTSQDSSPNEEKMVIDTDSPTEIKTDLANRISEMLTAPVPPQATEPVEEIITTNCGRYRLPKSSLPLLQNEPKAAIHIETATRVYIQVVTPAEIANYQLLKMRLSNKESERSWRDCEFMLFPTYDELCHLVLHKDATLAEAKSIDKSKPSTFYFVEPVPAGSSLHQYIQLHKHLEEADAQRIFRLLMIITAFCHHLGIMIRDLKLRKLVFEDVKCQILRLVSPLELKVSDDIADDALTDRHGCPAYVSPEIVSLNATSYAGKPADMWSAGVLLYVMLVGRYPFYDATATRLFEKIRKAEFRLPNSFDMSLDVRIVINSLLRLDPKKRPSAMRLLRISWMQPDAVQKMKALAPPAQIRRYYESDDQVVPVAPQPQNQIQERLTNSSSNNAAQNNRSAT